MAESKIPINRPTLISIIHDFTSNTSLEYTGVSVTIPGGTIFAVNFQILYMSTPPLEILISRSSTSKDPYQAMAHYSDATYANYAGFAPGGTDLTIYVWARYGISGANKIAIRGWYKCVQPYYAEKTLATSKINKSNVVNFTIPAGATRTLTFANDNYCGLLVYRGFQGGFRGAAIISGYYVGAARNSFDPLVDNGIITASFSDSITGVILTNSNVNNVASCSILVQVGTLLSIT